MSLRQGLAVAAVALAAGTSAGCGSCVKVDERIVVDVIAGPDVNAGGGTPQPVRLRVWGVKDRALFESVAVERLVEGDAAALERQGIGRAFEDGSGAWVRPGGTIQTVQKRGADEEIAFVGIAVRFPTAKREVIALDCSTRPGYTLARPEHKVVFRLEKDSIVVGGAEPAAK